MHTPSQDVAWSSASARGAGLSKLSSGPAFRPTASNCARSAPCHLAPSQWCDVGVAEIVYCHKPIEKLTDPGSQRLTDEAFRPIGNASLGAVSARHFGGCGFNSMAANLDAKQSGEHGLGREASRLGAIAPKQPLHSRVSSAGRNRISSSPPTIPTHCTPGATCTPRYSPAPAASKEPPFWRLFFFGEE